FALLWEISSTGSNATLTGVLLALYIFSTTFLFVSVSWSKFAHMFYKPVMAYQRRVEEADGSSNLPPPAAPRQAEPRQIDPRQIDPRQADPRQADPRQEGA
ncbi:MAG: hypothetical protein V3S07_07480, partial [Micropepsaceae bacterium]